MVDEESKGLECLRCGCRDFRVLRTVRKPGAIQRVRVCRHCGRQAVTYERIAGAPPDPTGRPRLAELRDGRPGEAPPIGGEPEEG